MKKTGIKENSLKMSLSLVKILFFVLTNISLAFANSSDYIMLEKETEVSWTEGENIVSYYIKNLKNNTVKCNLQLVLKIHGAYEGSGKMAFLSIQRPDDIIYPNQEQEYVFDFTKKVEKYRKKWRQEIVLEDSSFRLHEEDCTLVTGGNSTSRPGRPGGHRRGGSSISLDPIPVPTPLPGRPILRAGGNEEYTCTTDEIDDLEVVISLPSSDPFSQPSRISVFNGNIKKTMEVELVIHTEYSESFPTQEIYEFTPFSMRDSIFEKFNFHKTRMTATMLYKGLYESFEVRFDKCRTGNNKKPVVFNF